MFQRQGLFGGNLVTLRGTPKEPSSPVNPFLRMGQAKPSDSGWNASDKTARLIGRLCEILRGFSDRQVDEAVAGKIFWSYADFDQVPDQVVIKKVSENCPGLAVPARSASTPTPLTADGPPGFHGKTQLGYEEAQDLAQLLEVVLAPLTPEEAASEIADQKCLRELTEARGFPIVERLQERLRKFFMTAQETDSFEISQGEAVVTAKAVECAETLKRVKTTRTALTVGGVALGGGILLLLLGVL